MITVPVDESRKAIHFRKWWNCRAQADTYSFALSALKKVQRCNRSDAPGQA